MTAKEKAKELFDKYFLLHESATDENGVWVLSALNRGLAKKCALIAVDEILEAITFNMYDDEDYNKEDYYWEQVKIEIEKL
jgi:hypothetical protein